MSVLTQPGDKRRIVTPRAAGSEASVPAHAGGEVGRSRRAGRRVPRAVRPMAKFLAKELPREDVQLLIDALGEELAGRDSSNAQQADAS